MKFQDFISEASNEQMWKEYEQRLKKHDWYYEYSDDFRVWEAGSRSYDELERMRKKLMKIDSKRATELWDKYSPFSK